MREKKYNDRNLHIVNLEINNFLQNKFFFQPKKPHYPFTFVILFSQNYDETHHE